MKLKLKRIARRNGYTIGLLFINGAYFCDTLEPTDRALSSTMNLMEIRKIKVKGHTAIPIGTYSIDLNTFSPRCVVRGGDIVETLFYKSPNLINNDYKETTRCGEGL